MKIPTFLKRIILIILPLVLLTAAFPVYARATRTVRISCGINFVLYYDDDGNITGQCKEYLDALATAAGWEFEYVDATVRDAISMLDSGEIDIMLPVGDLTENHEQMQFSRLPCGYTALGIFASDDSVYEYENFSEFDGARIAVLDASSHVAALEAYAETNGFKYTEVPVGTSDDIKKELASGGADMAVGGGGDDFPGAVLIAMMDATPFYFAVKKGNTELLDELDHAMQQLMQTNSELVAETYRQCLTGDNKVRMSFTEDEWQFIRSGTEIRVGFYEETDPLAYIDSSGEYAGVYVDILEHLADTIGLNIELIPISRDTETWLEPLSAGDIDFYIGSALSFAQDSGGLIATQPIIDYDIVLVTEKDRTLTEASKPVIALTSDRSYWMDSLRIDADVMYCRTAKDCLMAVAEGRAEGALLNNYEFNYHMKNGRFENLVQLENYRYEAGACLTASADIDPVMFSIINKSLSALSDDDVDNIIYKNINNPYTSETIADKLYSARWIIIVCCVIIAAAAVISILIRRLRVRERRRQEDERRQLTILAALSRDYASVYYVNFTKDDILLVWSDSNPNALRETFKKTRTYCSGMGDYMDEYMDEEYAEHLSWLRDKEAVLKKLDGEGEFSVRFRVKPNERHLDFYEFHFVSVKNVGDGRIAVVGLRCVDDAAKEEQEQKRLLKDALEAAQHASSAKSDFLSKMSHDIRTPMNAIIGMTAIAAAHIDSPERVQDALKKITASSRHLLGLINEVLDMSKIESGTISLNESAFNLSELINNLVMMIQPQIKEHGHELLVQIHNIEHEDVIGDSLRIQQAFVNICGNAIKYTPDHGKISISIRECPTNIATSACYEFVFEDNGIGMSKEYLEHIFEPFTRADDVRTSKIQGTGLGMAITQNVVNLMNGDIKVESELGVGSKFTVTIFLKLQQPHEQDTGWLQGLRVIAVDDDPDICETVCETLKSIGMEGVGYTSGREAVKAVERAQDEGRDFYAAILDWKMPDMDGIATAKAIKKAARAHIPIIILSAYDWTDIEMEARAAGVDAFLSKPVFRSDLIRTFSHIDSRAKPEEPEENTQDSLKALEGQDYSGKRALLVEDNELNREIAEEILSSTGLSVETAEDGREAVDKFAQSEPDYYDIIFMDIQMPVMNGYDAAMAIRALSREDAQHVPIIAMTANAFVEDIQAAKSAGMNEHIAKPIDFDKLSEVLKKYM